MHTTANNSVFVSSIHIFFFSIALCGVKVFFGKHQVRCNTAFTGNVKTCVLLCLYACKLDLKHVFTFKSLNHPNPKGASQCQLDLL